MHVSVVNVLLTIAEKAYIAVPLILPICLRSNLVKLRSVVQIFCENYMTKLEHSI
jgi:hypothetical protein